MLPRRHRLTDRTTFTTTVRSGRRIKAGTVVGHFVADSGVPGPRIGLIVSKKVGSAVQRNRVSRVIRHAAAAHLADLPKECVLVVRALPDSRQADSAVAADVATLIARAGRP